MGDIDQRNHPVFKMFGRPVAFHRAFVDITGSVTAALMLSQAFYWMPRTKNPDGWFYKSADEWQEETGLTRREQETARKKLRKFDWWQEELRKANGVPTMHYRIDPDGFYQIVQSGFDKCANSGFDKCAKPNDTNAPNPLTETTTETTQETTLHVADATLTPQQEMFGAVCEAIGWDYHTLSKGDRGQVAQAVGILTKANYGVEDIRYFMTDFWFKDWRWVDKAQHPTLKQLRQEIGKTRSVIKDAAPKKQTGLDAHKEYMRRRGMAV